MSLFAELKRRNVFRMAVLYLISGWLILQVADVLAGVMALPDWTLRLVAFILMLGFPLALAFSWIYELTPEGLKLEKEIDSGRSITAKTGRRINLLIAVVALVAVALFGYQWVQRDDSAPEPVGVDAVGTASENEETGAVPSAPVDRSVAILPFANLSTDPDQQYFADGLAEEILNRLAHLPELLVTARTSSFQFRDTTLSIPEIAAQLGVAHVVEGSVRRFGNQLRVTAQLIRAKDGFHVWSENYDRQMDDLFAIQDAIAEKVANALDVYLDAERRAAIERVGTRNVEAFEYWTRANRHFDAYHTDEDRAGLWKANELFERAVAADPTFSAAHLFHSDLYTHFLFADDARLPGNHPPDLDEASAYQRMQRDLRLAEEYAYDEFAQTATRVDRLFLTEDWNELPSAMKRLEALLESGEGSPGLNQWAEVVLSMTDRHEGSIAYTTSKLARDPLSRFIYNEAAGSLIHAGRFDEALALVGRGRELLGDHVLFARNEAKLYRVRKDAQAALDALDRFGDETKRDIIRIWAQASLGRCDEARQGYRERLDDALGDNFLLVWVDAWLGERERMQERIARLDESPIRAAMFGRAAWELGMSIAWDPALMPGVTQQFREAGKELVPIEGFEPLCPQAP